MDKTNLKNNKKKISQYKDNNRLQRNIDGN